MVGNQLVIIGDINKVIRLPKKDNKKSINILKKVNIMETRNVRIVNNKAQKQTVIENSTATTLGELKAEMRAHNIDYNGMTFYEGHMRVELKDDASILPTNIPYKGTVTNDLVFLLTAPEKKIKSGAMTRNELITEAKRLGFSGNPTQTKSAVLEDFINGNTPKATEAAPATKKAAKKEETKVEEAPIAPAQTTCPTCTCKKAVKILAEILYDNGNICDREYEEVLELLEEDSAVEESTEGSNKLSQREIDELFDFV